MSKRRPVALAAPIAVVLWAGLVWSQPALCKITSAELSKVIDDSKVLGSDTDVRTELHEDDKEAVIFATRNPDATDKDCKIDAVLIAKKVMDADPAGVSKVKVRFIDKSNTNSYREISVRAGDVKAYAARVIDQETLLDELDLVKGQSAPAESGQLGAATGPAGQPEVGAGVLREKRARLLALIIALRSRGVGVSPFMARFNQIENQAQDGSESDVSSSIRSLEDAVGQQNKQLQKIQEQKQAQETERKNRMMEERRRLVDRNPAGQPAQPGAGGPGTPSAHDMHEEWEHSRREEFDKSLDALGDLSPVKGPHRHRRGRIAFKIKDMRDNNKNVTGLMKAWNDLQRLAANGDEAGVEARCAALENAMGNYHEHHHHEE